MLNKRQASRYLRDLQPFVGSMTLAYRKGALNEADPLSRCPTFVPQATVPLFWGARRRRSGGGPGGRCARKPVGTYVYLHAVGAGNPIAVLGLAR
jgi:hypothetical protein